MLKAGLTTIIGIMALQTGALSQLSVKSSGNVGIGTTTPAYKLHVIGDVRANNFISATKTYADYVFDSSYYLTPLPEVEAFIKQNHHLKDVPSEKDVFKDGMNLTNHQVILLKKIEELTLYIIDHNKKLQEQDVTQNNQNEKLLQLEERINAALETNNKLKQEAKELKEKQ